MAKVYERAIGYIHLSEQHILQALETLDWEEGALSV